jgi:hypothetical protein
MPLLLLSYSFSEENTVAVKKKANVDPLPVIRAWLDQHSYHDASDCGRGYLLHWLDAHCPYLDADQREVAADCLIVAGIGNQTEQHRTVYCRAINQ